MSHTSSGPNQVPTAAHDGTRTPAGTAALAAGLGTAVAMWCVWLALNAPEVGVPRWVQGGAMVLILSIGCLLAGRAGGWRLGLGAGLVSSLVNLLLLGSLLAQASPTGEPTSTVRPNAGLGAAGFVAFCAIVGAACGVIGGFLAGRGATRPAEGHGQPGARSWLWWLAAVNVAAFAPVLLIGGLVTSTRSGMAVPDWPSTYGVNMFLYPIGLMTHPRVFMEHSHRLFGSLVGLTSLVLLVQVARSGAARSVKGWSAAVFALVCVQGLLGAGRVTANNPALGAVHGFLSQVVLGMAVVVAVRLSPSYTAHAASIPDERANRRRRLTTGLTHALLLQLALGAAYRHLRQIPDLSPGVTHGLLGLHVLVSLGIVGMAVAAGSALRAGAAGALPRRVGTGLIAVVALQFVLGWVALWAVFAHPDPGAPPTADALEGAAPVPTAAAVIPTLHQVNGALLLALAVIGWAWCRRPSHAEARRAAPE